MRVEAAEAPAFYPEMARRALASWSRASQGALGFEEAAASESPGIRIHFGEAPGKYGETSPFVDRGSREIRAAEVLVLLDPPGDQLQKEIVVYLTALHEIGHALGFAHTDSFDSIMYRFQRPSDGPRYFLRYRQSVHSVEEIGGVGATGLFPVDLRALAELYPR